ncbi:MAG: hypothetical protein JRS35_19360 [Deltaproteobacteria bacterium]|nr:hypothetical protein [Deltaproteobacteria bacterium]
MSTTEAACATHLYEWLPSQLELHEPYIHVEALGRGKALPFDCWIARFRCVVEAR